MTEEPENTANGWAVDVTTAYSGGDIAVERWFVAIPERNTAEEAVSEILEPVSGRTTVRAIARLTASTIAGVRLRPGEMVKWL
jgi:hypothetical protein